jgi:hypothetical protein
VVVPVRRFGTERMVVEAAFTMLNALLPAVCSSQIVRSADWVVVAVEVPKALLPSMAAMEKNGVLFEEEATWKMAEPTPVVKMLAFPSTERRDIGEVDPMPSLEET